MNAGLGSHLNSVLDSTKESCIMEAVADSDPEEEHALDEKNKKIAAA